MSFRLLRLLYRLLLLSSLPACSAAAPVPALFPATYRGEPPCADCAGVSWQLDLWDERYYTLRQQYPGKPAGRTHDQMGVWRLQDGQLLLQAAGEEPLHFAAQDGELRQLDGKGLASVPGLHYRLRRAASFEPIQPRLRLSGLYQYQADAGSVELCSLGLRLPVAAEGDNAALERAYLALRRQAGEKWLLTLQATLAPRQGENGWRLTLVPEQLEQLLPSTQCLTPSQQTVLTQLQRERWYLRSLAGQAVSGGAARPYLELEAASGRVRGFAGCNDFGADYVLRDGALSFGQLHSTDKACQGVDESGLLAALAATRQWQAQGGDLSLRGEQGQELARFMPLLQ